MSNKTDLQYQLQDAYVICSDCPHANDFGQDAYIDCSTSRDIYNLTTLLQQSDPRPGDPDLQPGSDHTSGKR